MLEHEIKEFEKILWKNQDGFWRNQSTTSYILSIVPSKRYGKKTEVTQLFIDFSTTFYFMHT